MRGDDALGPMIVDQLIDHGLLGIDAGPTPENVTGKIKRLQSEAIIFIDALVFRDLPAGSPGIVDIDDLRQCGGSSHTLSLDFVMDYVKAETGADVFMIGVQPGQISESEGLSPGMAESIERISSTIIKVSEQR
jgi:hydrogenase 3 maturation protease